MGRFTLLCRVISEGCVRDECIRDGYPHRDGQEVLVHGLVEAEDVTDLCVRLRLRKESGHATPQV